MNGGCIRILVHPAFFVAEHRRELGATSDRRHSGELAQVLDAALYVMKQIHVWRNHIRIAHIDLVLYRSNNDSLARTLGKLERLGFDTRPGNVVVHDGVPTN